MYQANLIHSVFIIIRNNKTDLFSLLTLNMMGLEPVNPITSDH